MAAGVGDGFDLVSYEMGRLDAGGGGGGDITVESKSISSNGTYTAPTGKAYSPVTVNVANSYAAGDEGKVVSNGALVAQGSDTVTQNGTVDTTLINSLTVNVSGGGGGSSWTLLASDEFAVNTSSTTETVVGTLEFPSGTFAVGDIVWVHIRDKAGPRAGYFYGHDDVAVCYLVNGTVSGAYILTRKTSSAYTATTSAVGVFAKIFNISGNYIQIAVKYSSTNSTTIDGTYKVDVYKLTPASGMVMFE